MKSLLKAGVCVSCGRASGRLYRVCPYCDERVWQPRGRRVSQCVLLAAPPLLLALLAAATRPDLGAFTQAIRAIHPAPGFLLAAGLGLLLLPPPDGDVVITSRAAELRGRAGALLGGWLMGLAAAAGAVCLAYGRAAGAAAWLAACALAACVAAAPFFFRIPWRSLAAAALLAAALALANSG